MTSSETIGSIRIVLYAGLPGRPPGEIGSIHVPLALRSPATGVIEGELQAAVVLVKTQLERIFSEPPEPEPDLRGEGS